LDLTATVPLTLSLHDALPISGALDRVSGKVEVGDGLELVAGGEIPPTERPVEGVPILHSIKVLPKKDGIFTVSAVLGVDAAGESDRKSTRLNSSHVSISYAVF